MGQVPRLVAVGYPLTSFGGQSTAADVLLLDTNNFIGHGEKTLERVAQGRKPRLKECPGFGMLCPELQDFKRADAHSKC
jgi:hypothetical protein